GGLGCPGPFVRSAGAIVVGRQRRPQRRRGRFGAGSVPGGGHGPAGLPARSAGRYISRLVVRHNAAQAARLVPPPSAAAASRRRHRRRPGASASGRARIHLARRNARGSRPPLSTPTPLPPNLILSHPLPPLLP